MRSKIKFRFSKSAIVSIVALSLVTTIWTSNLNAKEASASSNKSSHTAKKKSVAQKQQLNPVVEAVKNAGVVNCLGYVDTVASFLTKGSQQSGVALFMPPQAPNQQITSASFEVESAQTISYASADFAPTALGCNSTYESVTYWQSTCQDLATKVYGQLKPMGAIHSLIKVLDGGPQLRIFLMPAGVGCISIKKEMIY